MAKRFGRATDNTWKIMTVRKDAVARQYPRFQGRVMFPSSHDIVEIPTIEEACFEVLKKLLERGNNVLVTTKPRKSVIEKIDKRFSEFKNQIQFRFTITSKNNNLLKFWEPNAPLFEERMSALSFVFSNEYKTSVSIEPFLDHDPQALVKIVEPYSTESIWIGKMNYIQRNKLSETDMSYYSQIRENYDKANLIKIYEDLKDSAKIRFKHSFRSAILL
jgi:hypothetical protein